MAGEPAPSMNVLGIPVFEEVSALGLGLLVCLYGAAFTIKGIFGYGAVPLLVVFGALIVGPHHAVLLAALSNLFSHIQFIPEGLRAGDRRLTRGLILVYVPTIVAGIWIFGRLEANWLNLVMGSVIALVVGAEALNLFRRFEASIRARTSLVGPLLAAISGLLAGMIGTGGIVLVSLYVKIVCTDKRVFRATILLIATFVIGWRTLVLGYSGFITWSLVLESLMLLPMSVGAGVVGTRIFGRMTNKRFFSAFQIMLLFAAVFLIIRALQKVL
jgi:uncharacterized protein